MGNGVINIKGDAEVMLMLKFLTIVKDQVCDVYVVGGKKGSLEHIDEDKSVSGGDTMGDEAVRHRVVEFESVRRSNVESVNKSKCTTRSRKETTSKAGKLKSVSTQNIVEKRVESSVKKSLFQSSQKSVVESVGKSVGARNSAAKDVGKSVGEDVGARDYAAKDVGKSVVEDEADRNSDAEVLGEDVGGRNNDAEDLGDDVGAPNVSVEMRDRTDESVGDKADQSMGVGMGYDSEDDGSYIPSSEDEETDDDMDAEDLVSEDEEYTQGRKKAKDNKEKEQVGRHLRHVAKVLSNGSVLGV